MRAACYTSNDGCHSFDVPCVFANHVPCVFGSRPKRLSMDDAPVVRTRRQPARTSDAAQTGHAARATVRRSYHRRRPSDWGASECDTHINNHVWEELRGG